MVRNSGKDEYKPYKLVFRDPGLRTPGKGRLIKKVKV
jgi:hypothetical protein